MSKKSGPDIWVSPRGKDGWAVQRAGSERAVLVTRTQDQAIDRAGQLAVRQGGAEIVVQGRDGAIRSKDSVGGKHDPFPPRDREH